MRLRGLALPARWLAGVLGVLLAATLIESVAGTGTLVLPHDASDAIALGLFVLADLWLLIQSVRMGAFVRGTRFVVKSWLRNYTFEASEIDSIRVFRYTGALNAYDVGGSSFWIKCVFLRRHTAKGIVVGSIPVTIGSAKAVRAAVGLIGGSLSVTVDEEDYY